MLAFPCCSGIIYLLTAILISLSQFLPQMTSWTRSFQSLLHLFLEEHCPLCDRSAARMFCQDCERRIKYCQFPDPQILWHPPLPVFAWGVYKGALKQAIAKLKYHNQPQIARSLGHWLAHAWLASAPVTKMPIVVPIPMYPEKKKKRGFDQAELIAEAFCAVTKLPLQTQGLERQRATEAQFSLSPEAREQNLAGAFQVGKGFMNHLPSQEVLLLDDIYTTGATVRSAVQTLVRHHIRVCGVGAIAAPMWNPQPGNTTPEKALNPNS